MRKPAGKGIVKWKKRRLLGVLRIRIREGVGRIEKLDRQVEPEEVANTNIHRCEARLE
jgi:hypothetical protein